MYQRMCLHEQESPHILDATGYLALFDAGAPHSMQKQCGLRISPANYTGHREMPNPKPDSLLNSTTNTISSASVVTLVYGIRA